MAAPELPSWLPTFADEAALSDLLAAARDCMAEADDCAADECPHNLNLMTPLEFAQWVELKVRLVGTQGRRVDIRQHIADGARRRWSAVTEARATA